MSIKKTLLKTYEVSYECDYCKKGKMSVLKLEDGATIHSGRKIKHICNKCGKTLFLNKAYPYKEYNR